MRTGLFSLCLLLLATSCVGVHLNIPIQSVSKPHFNLTLKDIGDRINQSSTISSYALGSDRVWEWLLEALMVSAEVYQEMQLYKIHVSYSDNGGDLELIVSGTTTVWNISDVEVAFVIYIDSDLELALQFGYNGTQIPTPIYPPNNQSWFSGLTLVGENTVQFSTSTFEDNAGNPFYQGLTITAQAITNEEMPQEANLYQLVYGKPPNKNRERVPLEGQLVAIFPLSIGQPLATVTLTFDGTIYFTSPNVVSNNLVLNVQVSSTDASATLNTDVTISNLGGQGNPPVTFYVTSSIDITSGFTFNGDLEGTWTKPFGVTWMMFQSLDINFVFDPIQSPVIADLQFNGGVEILFSNASQLQPITVSFNGELSNDVQQIEIDVDVPDVDLITFFHDVVGKAPAHSDEVTISGSTNFVLSTYSGQYQQGLTIVGDAILTGNGTIAGTIRSFYPEPATWTYNFQLYAPIFSTNPQDINFYLTESGPIPLTKTLLMQGYHVEFDLTPVDQAVISTNIEWDSPNGTIDFTAEAQVQSSNGQNTISLAGAMQGTLYNALGFEWLSLTNIKSTLVITNGVAQAFSFQGIANITFGKLEDATITVDIPGPNFSQFSLSLSVTVDDMHEMVSAVSQDPQFVPGLLDEVSFSGTIAIATFSTGNVPAGLTLSGNWFIEQGGAISNVTKTVNPNATLTFDSTIVLPIFAASPWDITFSLQEQGEYILSQSITILDVGIFFQIGEAPTVVFSTNSLITMKQHNEPFHILFSTQIDTDTVDLSLSGSIEGSWQIYDNIDWLVANDANATITFGEAELETFSVGGTCNITILGNVEVGFDLETANDFFDSYIIFDSFAVANLGDLIGKITNATVPSYISNLMTVTNTFSLILSTYNTENIVEGLTIKDVVKVNGQIVEQLQVLNKYGAVSNNSFVMSVTLPVFGGNPIIPSFDIVLNSRHPVQIESNMVMKKCQLVIDTADGLNLTVSAVLGVTFTNNQQLDFEISGAFDSAGTVTFSGDYLGTWSDVFGIDGLNISDVTFSLGLNPTLCPVDACIASLALGYNLTFGSDKLVSFYGSVNIPQLWDIFLRGQFVGVANLDFVDLVVEWNNLIGNSIQLPINPNSVPQNWGFSDTEFLIAPTGGEFNGITYQPGFWVDGGWNIWGLNVTVDIQVTTEDISWQQVVVDLQEFENAIKHELGLAYPNQSPQEDWVSINGVNITDLTLWNMAHGIDARFDMEYTWMNNNHDFSVEIPFLNFDMDFHDFFEKYLKPLFQ